MEIVIVTEVLVSVIVHGVSWRRSMARLRNEADLQVLVLGLGLRVSWWWVHGPCWIVEAGGVVGLKSNG